MPVLRTYVPKSLQNYNHLVYCPGSGLSAAVDPYDAKHLMDAANARGFKLTQIWITHEHGDHIRNLEQLKAKTGAQVFAPLACKGKFKADHWLEDGDTLNVGETRAEFWYTPGHTPGHGVFYLSGPSPELICGDTLFNAGVGNTRSGNVDTLFSSIKQILQRCAPETRIYPGHDYLLNNLNFALDLEPSLHIAQKWVNDCSLQTPKTRSTTTLLDEYQFNPFLRLEDPSLKKVLQDKGYDISSPVSRFSALRQLRDQW